jgi:2-iminobutanoate/2-iminopropanoate deaminase
MRQTISTEHAPRAIGPYSQAVVYGGLAYLSGQIALDPASNKVIEGGITAQTERVLTNIKAVLEAAGASLDSVLKTTVFLKDMEDFVPMNQVYERYFAKNPPARSTVQAAKLPRDVSVEIDVIAAILEPAEPRP